MVEKIQKLRNGQAVSRQDWEASKAAFETAYQDATPELKAQVDGYIRSMQNYSNANPMNNRSQREYETEGYNIATKILNGDTSNIHRSMGATTKNIFNGYSHAENKANAANVYVDYTMRNKAKSMVQPAVDASSGIGTRPYAYNWANGLDSDWTSDTDTLEERMGAFADAIRTNLNAARNSGRKVVGITDDEISQALALLNKESWTKEDLKTLRKAAQLAHVDAAAYKSYFGDLMPGQSPQEKAKAQLIKERGLSDFDNSAWSEWAKSYAKNKGYQFMQDKDGNVYAFDKNWAQVGKDGKINISDDAYGQGFFINDNGEVGFIDRDLTDNDKWYTEYNALANEMKGKYSPQYLTYTFNIANDYTDSDLMQNVIDLTSAQNPNATQASYADVSNLFEGELPIIAYTTDGTELKLGKFGELKINNPNVRFAVKDASGEIKNNLTLDQISQLAGKFNIEGFNEQKNLAGRYQNDIMSNFANVEGLDLNELLNKWNDKRFWAQVGGGAVVGGAVGATGAGIGAIPGAIIGGVVGGGEYAAERLFRNDTIKDDPKRFVRAILSAYTNPDARVDMPGIHMKGGDFLLSMGEGNQKAILETVGKLVYDGTVQLTPAERKQFNTLIRDVYFSRFVLPNATPQQKNGGVIAPDYMKELILYAEKGVTIMGNSPDSASKVTNWHEKFSKPIDEAEGYIERGKENANRTGLLQKAAEQSWSPADTLRATALATDIIGLIGAATGAATAGVGSAVAVGSGFLSMGIDAAADFNDDSVSTGQALKNMGINAGLAVGSMFGAKAPKIVKSVLKLLPKAMMAAGAAGIAFDPEVHNTINRMQQGKTMNAGDWKNIITVLRTVTNIGTVGTLEHGANKATKKFQGRVKNELQKVQSQVDPNITYVADADGKAVALDKKLAEDVSKLLKDGKKDDALALLAKGKDEGGAGLNSDVAESIIDKSNGSRGFNPFKKKFWKPGEENALRTATEEQSFGALPEDVVAEAKLNALNAAENDFNTAANKNWFTRGMNRWDKRVQRVMPHVAPQQRYEINAAVGTAYKNEAELRKDLNDKISTVGAFDEGDLNGANLKAAMDPTRNANKVTLDAAQKNSDKLKKDVDDAKKVVADLQKQIDDLNLSGQLDKLKLKRAELDAADKKVEKLNLDYYTSLEELLRAKNAFSSHTEFKAADQSYRAAMREYKDAKAKLDSYMNSSDPKIRALFKVDADGKIIPKLTTRASKDPRYAHIVKDLARYNNSLKGVTTSSKYADFRKAVDKKEDVTKLYNSAVDEFDAIYDELRSAGKRFNKDVQTKRALEPQIGKEHDNLHKAEGTAEKARKKVEETKTKNRESFAEEWRNQLGAVGTDAGTTRKAITTKDATGADVKIPSGTKVKSYLHIRNPKLAMEVAKQQHPSGKVMTAEEASKWVNSQQKSAVNGAIYDSTTGELVLFKEGGLMNTKYSHLRK